MGELTDQDVEALRRNTPGCAHRLHLNNAGASLLSTTTITAMKDHLDLEATIGGYEAAAQATDRIDDTYRALAELLGAGADEIALFDNSTHAWNAAFYSFDLGPGDRILTARDEYGSNVLAYLQVARRTGAELVVVPNDEHGQVDTAALAELVDDRTRLIGLTWIPTSGGLVNPAAEVGRIAKAAGVPYLLDATQAVGQLEIDVDELGCDFLTGTGRKFLRGPRGTGFLYARRSVVESLEAFEPPVVEIRSATWDGDRSFTWADGARRFETWENSYVNVVGLGSAVRQALDLGLDAIQHRAVGLGALLREGLDALPTVTVADLGIERCAIVTCAVEGFAAGEMMDRLADQRINVSTSVPEHTQLDTEDRHVHPLVRLSPHCFTTEAEIEQTVAAVAALRA